MKILPGVEVFHGDSQGDGGEWRRWKIRRDGKTIAFLNSSQIDGRPDRRVRKTNTETITTL